MNAFIQILEQLLASMSPDLWVKQRFYPFDEVPIGPLELFDACVFQQDANGALGMAWLRCPNETKLLTFPFRIARYSQDGDMIALAPWSLREASTDALFYAKWKHAVTPSGRMATVRGGTLLCRQFEGQSSFNIINLWTDNKNSCTRVETQHLCKIFRIVDPRHPHSIEADVLEYLNSQNHFLQHPELTTRYDLIPAYSDTPLPIAIVTRYIQSNSKLWQHLTAKIQHARYPEPMRERSSRSSWSAILDTVGKLGRLLAEFHVAMTHSKNNPWIDPESNAGAAKEKWSELTRRTLNQRIYTLRQLTTQNNVLEKQLENLPEYAHALFERVVQAEHLGLLIRIHGHAHLGQVLLSEDGLYLANYETDGLDDEEYRVHKQSCLKDLTAALLSLQFAWLTTERSENLPVFNEFLSAESEFGKHVIKSLENFSLPVRYEPKWEDLESTLIKSYLQTIAEDPTSAELLPEKSADLDALFDLCFLLRVLKESIRDMKNHNPRYKTDLKILTDLIQGKFKRPVFDSFFNSPSLAAGRQNESLSFPTDPDFS